MMNDDDSQWLRDRMDRLRERRMASATRFENVWRAARRQQAATQEHLSWPWWRLAGASVAAMLVTALVLVHTASDRQHHREKERDFATVDGALMTYWQAPTDDLLSMGKNMELPGKDE